MDKIRVGINGYGTVGRRVADAVLRQDDLELVGVTKTKPDFRFLSAQRFGIPVYAVADITPFGEAGYQVEGTTKDLLSQCDVVVDCSPNKCGVGNMIMYKQFPPLKAIFQGGEPHNIAGFSFNSNCNYEQARDRKYLRVVSCSTTALCRTLSHLNEFRQIKKVRVAIARRTIDPGANKKGDVNSWSPAMNHPTHHALDVQTILPDMNVTSLSGVAPMTVMHGQMLFTEFEQPLSSVDGVLSHLRLHPRISLVVKEHGLSSTAQLKEAFEHRQGNMYEVGIWKESLGIDRDGELGMHLAIDQQAITIPENIDAIRAMFGLMDAEESTAITNKSLGITNTFAVKTT